MPLAWSESLIKRKGLPEWEAKIEGGYYRARRWILTVKYHGYIIGDKNNEGQSASLRIKIRNVGEMEDKRTSA